MTMRGVILLVVCALSGLAQTTISDTYNLPGGGAFTGTLRYIAPAMTCGGSSYAAQDVSIPVTDGAVSLSLRANDGCTVLPGQINAYRVQWVPTRGPRTDEWWLVPTSASPLTIARVRTAGAPLAQPLTYLLQSIAASGALAGQIPQFNGTSWVPATVSGTGDMTGPSSSVDGEVAVFNQTTGKALKRATQTGVARLIAGVLYTVGGNPEDCVRVDGTSGACGGTGTGAVDSVFGRAGTVTAQASDYAAYYSQVNHLHTGIYEPIDPGILRSSGSYANPTWLTSIAWAKLSGIPTSFTPSVHASSHATAGADPISPISIGAVSLTGTYANPTWITSLDLLKVLPSPTGNASKVLRVNATGTGYELGAVTSGVDSFAGRTGPVVPAAGDYSGIYEPVDLTIIRSGGSYSNPTWLTSLAWSKVTGAPGTYAPSPHASAHMAAGGDPLSLTLAEIAAAAKTGTGDRAATASGVPADGCTYWNAGNLTSTGSPCGAGASTVSSVAYAEQAFTSAASVTVTHNFNSLLQTWACRDGSANAIEPDTVTVGLNSTTFGLVGSPTGTCAVWGGTGLYSQAFTGQTSVSLVHSFNTQSVSLSCYDGSNVAVEPNSWTATDANTVGVTFSTAQTGYCVIGASLALSGGGGGGVSSVALTVPPGLSVTGSPITGAGTLAVSTALSGILRGTGSGFAAATYSNVVALWAGGACGSGYLKWDGTCDTPVGGGGTYTAGDGIDATQLAASVIAVDATVPAVAVSGTQSLTFGTIAQSSCVAQNIAATGATVGDRVVPGYPATLPDGLMGMMFVSATDTVQVRLCKITAGSADVTGLTFTYQIIRAR